MIPAYNSNLKMSQSVIYNETKNYHVQYTHTIETFLKY